MIHQEAWAWTAYFKPQDGSKVQSFCGKQNHSGRYGQSSQEPDQDQKHRVDTTDH